jgi:hypothetical protein
MSCFLEKKKIDYSKSIIYKIVSKDLEVPYTYIGSTTNWYNRRALHKSDFFNTSSPRYHLEIYQFIRNHGDWSNFIMVMVEEFCCENKRQLEQREQYWKEQYNDNIGGKKAYITPEQLKEQKLQYYQDNKEHILTNLRTKYANDKSVKQKYYQDNKEKLLKYQKEKYQARKKSKTEPETKIETEPLINWYF